MINKKISSVFIFILCFALNIKVNAQVEIVSGGTAAAYTLNVPAVFPLRNGIQVTFKANVVCGVAPTIDVTSTGPILIKKEGGATNLAAGDIKAGQIVNLVFDGTFWQMLSSSGNPATTGSVIGTGTQNYVTKWNNAAGTTIGNSQIFDNGTNVGIGTATPNVNQILHIKGFTSDVVRVESSTSPSYLLFTDNTTTASPRIGAITNDLVIELNALERMRIKSTGNVGIGTISPGIVVGSSRYLTISSGVGVPSGSEGTALELQGGNSAASGVQNKIDFIARATDGLNYNTGRIEMTNTSSSTTQGQMHFYTKGGSILERMIIDENGNIGVGLTAPASKLHIAGQIRSGIPLGGLGGAAATTGSLLLYNSSNTNTVTIQSPIVTSTYSFTLPVNPGTLNYVLTTDGTGITSWASAAALGGAWTTTGNAGTVDGTNFIGTTDNVPFTVKVFGQKSGRIDNTNGDAFWGYQAGMGNTGVTRATAIGQQALSTNATGLDNTAIGYSSLTSNAAGINNVAVGNWALSSNTSGYDNVAMGMNAMRNNVFSSQNVALGKEALYSQSFGAFTYPGDNVAVGYRALYANQPTATTNGIQNTAIGSAALNGNTNGIRNVAIGYQTGTANTTGVDNVYLGTQAGWAGNSSSNNTFVGNFAGTNNTTSNSVFVGYNSGRSNTSGSGNTYLGYQAGYSNLTSNSNTMTGFQAGYSTTSFYNAFFGSNAGQGTTTGGFNTFLGTFTGANNTTGSNNIFIGYSADLSSTATQHSKAAAIGYNAKVDADNSLVLGGTGVDAINVGIGTVAPSTQLHIVGNARITGLVGPGTVIADASGNLSLASGSAVTGSGTTNYLARWTPSGSQLGIGLVYDNGTNVGVGTTTPQVPLHVANNSFAGIAAQTSNASATQSSSIGVLKSRGTIAAPTAILSGDNIGAFEFVGYTGSVFNSGANIKAFAAENFGAGNGADLTLNTTAVGSTSPLERIRISAAGNIGVNGAPTATDYIYVNRPTDFGANHTAIYAARFGGGGIPANGGTSWAPSAVDAVIKAYTNWGNNFTAGIAGYNFQDYATSAGVIGADAGGNNLGALSYKDASNLQWGLYTPVNAFIGTNLGIGLPAATSPTANLHVAGSARITSLVGPGTVIADASGNLSVVSGSAVTGSGTTNYLARWTPSGSVLGIGATQDNGTNVGIGATPVNKLDVEGGAAIGATYSGTNTAPANGLLIEGQTGIGLNSGLTAKLDVFNNAVTWTSGSTYANSIQGAAYGAAFSSRGTMGVSWATGTYGIGIYGSSAGAATNNYGVYGNATGGTTTNYAGYFDQGNVLVNNNLGIGIAPAYKLHVSLNTSGILANFDNNTVTGGTGLYTTVNTTATGTGNRYGLESRAWYGQSANYGTYSYGYGGTTSYGIYATCGGATTNYAAYLTGGDVYVGGQLGIGTVAPAYDLQLANNSAAKPTSNVWTVASDARLKTNVHDYTDGLAELLAIHPVWFTYTGEAGMPKETGVGVLAQELQKVAPYMVKDWKYVPAKKEKRTTEKSESSLTPANVPEEEILVPDYDNAKTYLAVDNGAVTYMTINAIREQQKQIEDLKKQLAELKKLLEQLQKK